MEVSRSGYYEYMRRFSVKSISGDFEVISKIREIHRNVRGKYGSRRISRQLKKDGYSVGRCKTRRLMRRAGVAYKAKKKFRRTTNSKHRFPVSPNLLNRNFDISAPNRVWCADITYLWTKQGWMYLAVVIDLYSRKIVGWSVKDHMKTSLVTEALSMAYFRRKPKKGLIHHSDRGSQYASHEFQALLTKFHMKGSMSRKGDCWDNAVAESFFGTLKTERTEEKAYSTRDELRVDVIEYIEIFYNSQRLHSTIDYMSPNSFESGNKTKLA